MIFCGSKSSSQRDIFCVAAVLIVLLVTYVSSKKFKMTDAEKQSLKIKTLEMFDHAYGSYKKYAHPADELMPLSCRGRYRGSERDRGDIDEALGNFSLTLIDTLDTLAVLGRIDEFDEQIRFVIHNVTFDADVVVSVFETNIRVLGGLLGAHSMAVSLRDSGQGILWYQNELIPKALDIGNRLLAAFNTTTGIPYPKVNLRYGVNTPKSRVGHETDTCTACAGTMIMEFGALSRLTGNQIYEDKAHKAMEAIWKFRSRHSDLVGTTINIHNGNWIRRDSGVGAGIDSYYEYCLKAYILFGDETYLDKFNKHYESIKRYVRQGYMLIDVMMHQPEQSVRSHMDALQAFWPGLLVLKGDLQPAIETHEMLYSVAKKFKFLPEAFTTNLDLHWAQHPLRPEFIESTYFLYQATKDEYYLHVGKHVLETLEEHARVVCGFAAFKDLRTFNHEDKMDSFVLAETFKYLYLLFSEESEHVVNVHDYLFTTEAHLLPLNLAGFPNDRQLNNITRESNPQPHKVIKDDHISCMNTAHSLTDWHSFAEGVRSQVNKNPTLRTSSKQNSCGPKNKPDFTVTFKPEGITTFAGERKLRAEDFQISNELHTQILSDLGISIVKSDDGKVQLVQQAGMASTTQDAQEGILFMQEMIQLAKSKGMIAGNEVQSSMVQILRDGLLVKSFSSGSAQFGPDLRKMDLGVSGEIVETKPFRACKDIENADELRNRIALIERSDCMFIDKVRLAQSSGALGAIIVDHIPGTSLDASQLFGMSGDSNSDDVTIPSVFLFEKEGAELREAMLLAGNGKLEVRIASSPLSEAAQNGETLPRKTTSDVDLVDLLNKGDERLFRHIKIIERPVKVVATNNNGELTITTIDMFLVKKMDGSIKKLERTTVKTCPTPACDDAVDIRKTSTEEDVDIKAYENVLSTEEYAMFTREESKELKDSFILTKKRNVDPKKGIIEMFHKVDFLKERDQLLEDSLAKLDIVAKDLMNDLEKMQLKLSSKTKAVMNEVVEKGEQPLQGEKNEKVAVDDGLNKSDDGDSGEDESRDRTDGTEAKTDDRKSEL